MMGGLERFSRQASVTLFAALPLGKLAEIALPFARALGGALRESERSRAGVHGLAAAIRDAMVSGYDFGNANLRPVGGRIQAAKERTHCLGRVCAESAKLHGAPPIMSESSYEGPCSCVCEVCMVTNVTQPNSGASNGAKETYVPPSIEELSADDPRVVAMMRARLADLLIVEQAAKRLQAFALDGPTPEKLGAARELDEALATSDKNRAALST